MKEILKIIKKMGNFDFNFLNRFRFGIENLVNGTIF